MRLSNKQIKDLGFYPFERSDFELIHWTEEIAFNTKNNTVYEFCELYGVGKSIVQVNSYSELKDLIENVLML